MRAHSERYQGGKMRMPTEACDVWRVKEFMAFTRSV